ncbi:MAG: translation initiation factor Sui1 [Calditrichia bacterium]
MKKSRPVYSTESGRLCPGCGNPIERCKCRKQTARQKSDGIVRIRREVKGRGGKTVTTISGLALDAIHLKELAGELKRNCGTGGSVKDGVIIIQGDHRMTLMKALQERGYTVKLAGG